MSVTHNSPWLVPMVVGVLVLLLVVYFKNRAAAPPAADTPAGATVEMSHLPSDDWAVAWLDTVKKG